MVSTHVVFDLDDLAENPERNCIPQLVKLKEKWPNLKVTLFAIPNYENEIQEKFFNKIVEEHGDWIKLGIHGWTHESNFECMEWNYIKAKKLIKRAYKMDCFDIVFKAPGWQISRDTYSALKELDFICADHKYCAYTEPGVPNKERRPKHLKVYEVDHEWMIHGHTWNCSNNGIDELIEGWEKDGYPWDENTKFYFISELFEKGNTHDSKHIYL